MFEHYYLKPDTIDRLRSSWIAEPIEQYVQWLDEQGYAPRNVYRRVPVLQRFGEFAQQHGASLWSDLPDQVEPFVVWWVREHGGHYEEPPLWIYHSARTPVEQMLKLILPNFEGRGRSIQRAEPFQLEAPGFFLFLRSERGLKASSIGHYVHYLSCFEAYLSRVGLARLCDLTPLLLSTFVIERAATLSKSSMTGLCCTLRVFLRYLYQQRLIGRDLGAAVESPRHYRFSNIPRSIAWEEVRLMLESVDRRSALGKRDYAILLLLVTYGLRGCEVAAMTLDDIDWQRERLLVPERKAGHTTAYPLATVVGEAILDYLQHGRPETSERHLFLRSVAPRHPLTSAGIGCRASRYLHKAGIEVTRAGSHTLRHACVQRLVDADFSFKTIGDYVGHASPDSTQIYTKVAIEALREVALGHGEELP
jgi:site-specific recombinase XerD